MGRRKNWQWFTGIAVVLGSVAACSSSDSVGDLANNACTLVETDGGTQLQCGGHTVAVDDEGALLVDASREPAGSHCQSGGARLDIGQDSDGDGELDPSEITTTQYACDGTSAAGDAGGGMSAVSLIVLTDEAPGDNCANGGQLVESGVDSNGNGELDSSEVSASEYLCDGVDGVTPAPGQNGTNGANGDAGADGLSSLVVVSPVAGGPQSSCPAGGQKIDFGLDDDRDSVLDQNEIDGTRYVCNGIDGDAGTDGLNTLVNVSVEPPGEHCTYGGQKTEWGVDDNRNGILDVPTAPVVNGDAGPGDAGPVAPSDAGSPTDGGILDGGAGGAGAGGPDAAAPYNEVDGVSYLCNSAPGLNSLVSISDEPLQTYEQYWSGWWWGWEWQWVNGACYPTSGKQIDFGLDDDRDGVLDQEEIDGTDYVCHGESSLVDVHPAPTQDYVQYWNSTCWWDSWWGWWEGCWAWHWVPGGPCGLAGGQQIDVGLDDDRDGELDQNEIDNTDYVCNDGAPQPD